MSKRKPWTEWRFLYDQGRNAKDPKIRAKAVAARALHTQLTAARRAKLPLEAIQARYDRAYLEIVDLVRIARAEQELESLTTAGPIRPYLRRLIPDAKERRAFLVDLGFGLMERRRGG